MIEKDERNRKEVWIWLDVCYLVNNAILTRENSVYNIEIVNAASFFPSSPPPPHSQNSSIYNQTASLRANVIALNSK